jgi:hypothetical protein
MVEAKGGEQALQTAHTESMAEHERRLTANRVRSIGENQRRDGNKLDA